MGTKKSASRRLLFSHIFKKSLPFLLSVVLVILILATIEITFQNRFYPGVSIGDSDISFMTKTQAYSFVSAKINQRLSTNLNLTYQDQNFPINLTTVDTNINYSQALADGFTVGHSGNILKDLVAQTQALFLKNTISPQITLNVDPQIQLINKTINKDPVDATLWLDEQKAIHTTDSATGTMLDTDQLTSQIKHYLSYGTYDEILPINTTAPGFTTEEAQNAKLALEKVKSKPIKLNYKEISWIIDVPTLYHLLNLSDGETLLDSAKLDNYIKDIAESINHPVEEPLFKFDEKSKRVTVFRPAVAGVDMDETNTRALILAAIQTQGSSEITINATITEPKIQTAEVNNLGVKELIGRGVSNFAGSIPNRIFNVELTASRINGVLVPPDRVFSFNATVGDVSAATGYKQAYVIKGGRTVLDDGGGVCQDSTTLFRAVLNAGLPIVARTAHAYRVGYYEQGFPPGLDATVFSPSVDFKFKNDTGKYILIQAYNSGTTLYIDLYGTSDGRVATLTTPVVTNQTPPPPELRQDDPTLPKGTVKQVDFAAWGAQVSFKRTVTRAGETIINETWRSNYKPWQAIFLVGTQ
ncbi:MAG: VanW family protein [Candidatus Daviesbacteria bacterium]|nr:VanW family protein [Candidatus Daviesbacteria bacterium]